MLSNPIIAVNTLAFHGYEFAQIFEEVKALGFSYVEPALISSYYPEMVDTYFSSNKAREMKKLISDNGLEVKAMAGHMDLGAEHAANSFLRRMEFARELGASIIHTNSTVQNRYPIFRRNISELAAEAESMGLVIALENPGDGENNIMGTGRHGSDLIRNIGSPFVRLNYDFSNVYSYSKGKVKPEEDFRFALPFTAHWHLKEMRALDDRWEFVAIGQGITDYDSIFRNLRGENLPPMSIELPTSFFRTSDYKIACNPNNNPTPLVKIREVLTSSRKYLLQLISGQNP